MKQNQHPKPKNDSPEKESTNRHVYIEPGAKIDFVQGLKDKYESAQSDAQTHNKKQLFWTKIASAFLLLTVLIAGVQGFLTRQSISDNTKQFQIDARAWVGPGTNIPKNMELIVPITNSGKTPALHTTEVWMPQQWCCDPNLMPGTPRKGVSEIQRHKGLLMPGATIFLNIPVLDIDPATGPVWPASKMIQEIRGRVDYLDIFHQKHWTRFCYVTIGPPVHDLGEDKNITNYRFQHCTHGNDTDDDPDPSYDDGLDFGSPQQ